MTMALHDVKTTSGTRRIQGCIEAYFVDGLISFELDCACICPPDGLSPAAFLQPSSLGEYDLRP